MPGKSSPQPDAVMSRDQNGIRISDADRHSVVQALGRHAGDGCLTIEELEERSARALAAKIRADLGGLLSDLPALPGPHSPAVFWAGASSEGARETPVRFSASAAPAQTLDTRKPSTMLGRLRRRFSSVATLGVLLTGIWLMSGGGYYWPMWVLVPAAFFTVL